MIVLRMSKCLDRFSAHRETHHMGAAALVMADITEIPYINIIIAALIPALLYYTSLFASVVFESRRLGIEAVADLSDTDEDLTVQRQDYYNLILIVVPITTVVFALLWGFSPAGAGNIALTVLIPLSFLNPEVRQTPILIIRALANGGRQFGELLMSVAVVGIIVAVLAATGLPSAFTLLVSQAGGTELIFTLMSLGVKKLDIIGHNSLFIAANCKCYSMRQCSNE